MFLVKSRQICAARGLFGISQAALAQWSGLSRGTLATLEAGHDSKVSSLEAVTQALEARGVLFTRDGVGIAQRMQWGPNPPSPEIRRRVLSGLNDARRARGDPPLIDDEDDQ
jgi:DNA-binding XRE family transcriptional regulator